MKLTSSSEKLITWTTSQVALATIFVVCFFNFLAVVSPAQLRRRIQDSTNRKNRLLINRIYYLVRRTADYLQEY